jgi:PEP-CTERM motif
MNPYRIALAATTALVASTSLSFAAVIAQTASYSAPTNWGTTTSNSSFTPTKTLNFAGFNPSLGTLTSVEVTVQESVTGSVNLKNNGVSTTDVTGNLQNTLKYILPTLTSKTLIDASNSFTDGSLGAGASSGSSSVSGSTSTTRTFSSGLGAFETAWSATVGDLGQVLVSSGNGNGSATYIDTGAALITADYTYTPAVTIPTPTPTPTPEPATMAVLGTGLAGLGLLRRRKASA